ncbi:MAG: hypothetical protein EOO24_01295 [Comamonadaceae bacterium]|nr:MAG: hypothetical protein EOO24_01295 [Comamonadaceae bacterium]
MNLRHHFQHAQTLSPRAAHFAAHLLSRAADIPTEWQLALRMGLLERAHLAPAFTTTDWMALTEASHARHGPGGERRGGAWSHDADERAQARRFVDAVRSSVLQDRNGDGEAPSQV